MVYKLNDKKITKKEVETLLEDLAMFPYIKDDYAITIEKRKEKYIEILKKDKALKIADNLIIIVTD